MPYNFVDNIHNKFRRSKKDKTWLLIWTLFSYAPEKTKNRPTNKRNPSTTSTIKFLGEMNKKSLLKSQVYFIPRFSKNIFFLQPNS